MEPPADKAGVNPGTMPYPRTSTGYPAHMRELVEAVSTDQLGRALDCGSPRAARTIRARFYQYLAALKRDASRRPEWMTEAEHAALIEFLRRFMGLEMAVNGSEFIMRPRDKSPSMAAFDTVRILPDAASSGSPSPAAAPKEVDASLARLLEKTRKPQS